MKRSLALQYATELKASFARLEAENAALREIVEAMLWIDIDSDDDDDGHIIYVDGVALVELQDKARALLGKSPEEVK